MRGWYLLRFPGGGDAVGSGLARNRKGYQITRAQSLSAPSITTLDLEVGMVNTVALSFMSEL